MSIDAYFSKSLKNVISLSREVALRYHNEFISELHVTYAILSDETDHFGFSGLEDKVRNGLLEETEGFIREYETSDNAKNLVSLPITKQLERLLPQANIIARELKQAYTHPIHLLLAVMRSDDRVTNYIFNKHGISYAQMRTYAESLPPEKEKEGWFWQRKK